MIVPIAIVGDSTKYDARTYSRNLGSYGLVIKPELARMKELGKSSSLAVQMCLQLLILITSEVGVRVQSVKVPMSKAEVSPMHVNILYQSLQAHTSCG